MSSPVPIVNDRFGAFVRETPVAIAGSGSGPLAGTTFAVKDAIDIRGYRTGAGNPDWLRTHPPAETTAVAVAQLLSAGADIVGKTQTDELTYSLNGENIHYGTPVNPKALGRIPGGSSSGSAVAVSGELVDFAIGTDCGGSVRAPASFCGIYGMRPSHGRISVDGVFRLAPSFDTVGWFSRDADLLARVGGVLLPADAERASLKRLLVATDAFDWCRSEVTDVLQAGVGQIADALGCGKEIMVAGEGLPRWFNAFRILQGAEIWAEHGSWIRSSHPQIAPGIRERFEWASTIAAEDVAAAQPIRDRVAEHMQRVLNGDGVLCLPTTPDIAPLLNLPSTELVEFRTRALSLLCVAGLARLPQINLPIATLDGCPLGLSIVGPYGSDLELLAIATRLTP